MASITGPALIPYRFLVTRFRVRPQEYRYPVVPSVNLIRLNMAIPFHVAVETLAIVPGIEATSRHNYGNFVILYGL
jgi:hypothetical protein